MECAYLTPCVACAYRQFLCNLPHCGLFILIEKEKFYSCFYRSFCVCFMCKCVRDYTLWVLDGPEGV